MFFVCSFCFYLCRLFVQCSSLLEYPRAPGGSSTTKYAFVDTIVHTVYKIFSFDLAALPSHEKKYIYIYIIYIYIYRTLRLP